MVGVANNGSQVLTLAATLRLDLVLTDLNMPEMNGLDATRCIKAQPNAPRVIVLTAEDAPQLRDLAQNAGADGFVPKADLLEQLPLLLRNLFGESET